MEHLLITSCQAAEGDVFLGGYEPTNPDSIKPENFYCPYAQIRKSDLCCKIGDLEGCLTFHTILDRTKKPSKKE